MTRLRRTDLDGPGIRRRRHGKGFSYSWADGTRVTDPDTLARIKGLAVPPAWGDVWICPWPHGHIQAVGTDAAGRRQYRYHDTWRAMRDEAKHERVLEFGRRLPNLRKQVAVHLELADMGRERVLGAAVRLLDVASLRVGGEEYAHDHETYGLATLLKRHVRVSGGDAEFCFTGKAGQDVRITIRDPDALAVIGELKQRRGGGPELLAWRRGRRWIDVRSVDVNEYIKELAGDDFSAKDFRTWNATVLAASGLAGLEPLGTDAARRRAVCAVVKEVAAHLGNTPAVCRASYIDPRVIDLYHEGQTAQMGRGRPQTRARVEAAVLALLDGGATTGGAGTVGRVA